MEVISLIIHGSLAIGSILFLIGACVVCVASTWMLMDRKWSDRGLLAFSVTAVMLCIVFSCIAVGGNHEELMQTKPHLNAEYLLSAWLLVFLLVALSGLATAGIYAWRHPRTPQSPPVTTSN